MLGLAAHQKAGDATTTMRGHHDQVAGTSPGDIDDRLVDVVPALRQDLARYRVLRGCFRDEIQIATGMGQAVTFVRRPCFLPHLCLIGQRLEGRNDMQSTDSGTQRAGELHPYENGAL